MSREWLVSFGLLALGSAAAAAAAPPPPSAGSTIQQVPQTPPPPKSLPEITVQGQNTPAESGADQVRFRVTRLNITGEHVFSADALLATSGFKPDSDLSLADLRNFAARIANYYHQHGYFVAQAYIPAQDVQDGIVTITVVEGHYGKVTLNNTTHLSDSLANDLLRPVRSGEAVSIAPLERSLLLLSDVPGVNVRSTLTPGASVGASDLIVAVTPGSFLSGSVDADNEGDRYTGPYRLGGTLNINDPSGHGDVVTLRALTSFGDLAYGRVAYQIQLDAVKLGVAYADMKYWLGKEFSGLLANGTAQIESLYGSYPIVRTRNGNLFFQLDYDFKRFVDDVDSTDNNSDKKAGVLMASLVGDQRDGLWGGALNTYSLTFSAGDLTIESSQALTADQATARTDGHYEKVALNASRLQTVADNTWVYLGVSGQLASRNLDISEQMELGGASAVRAYPEGEAYAVEGYVLNLELRRQLAWLDRVPGQKQIIAFADTGTVRLEKSPWIPGENDRTLTGAGLGFNWTDPRSFLVTAYLAHKIGAAAANSAPDHSVRFWIQAVKYFGS